jgi:hypothetical protein
MCLTLMVVSIVHRTVSVSGMPSGLQSMTVFDGVTSRDVVCGSAVVGSSGVVISCEVAVVSRTLTVVDTVRRPACSKVLARQGGVVVRPLTESVSSAVVGMSGLVMCADKTFSGMDISETLSADIGVTVDTSRSANVIGVGRDMVQSGYTIGV